MMLKLGLNLDLSNVYVILGLLFLLLLHVCVDVPYFLRVAFNFLYGKYCQNDCKVDDTTHLFGFSTTNDIDLFLNHMNNARYIREADFGRFHFFQRTGLYKCFKNGMIMQGACNIRYRKPIPIFTPFRVTTRIIYYDEKNIYFEQKFITNDKFVRAILISQNKVVGLNAAEIISKLYEKDVTYRMELPEEVKLWVSSIEVSSQRLRKSD